VADSGAEAAAIVLLLCGAVWLGEAVESTRRTATQRPARRQVGPNTQPCSNPRCKICKT
jgi:hypothetical protein